MPRLPLQEAENCATRRGIYVRKLNILTFQAQAASMTVAQAFNLAFVSWKDTQEKKKESVKVNENVASVPQPQQSEAGAEGEERLLIDLRSPGDSLDTGLAQELVRLEAEQRGEGEPDTEMDQSFAR